MEILGGKPNISDGGSLNELISSVDMAGKRLGDSAERLTTITRTGTHRESSQ